jgi:hypothetical protein
MSEMTTAAVIIGGAISVAKPVVETGCKLIESLLGEPCKIAGGMMADQIYCWQWENRVRAAHRAKELMDADRLAPKVLPPGFLIPLLEAAGNVDDPELQEMWARLLASAVASEKNQHPAFIHVLRELSRDEAVILNARTPRRFIMNEGKTPDAPNPMGQHHPDMLTARGVGYFWINVPLMMKLLRDLLSATDVELVERIHRESVLFYATHLKALGIVELGYNYALAPQDYGVDGIEPRLMPPEHVLELRDSDFGTRFIRACCRRPKMDSVAKVPAG